MKKLLVIFLIFIITLIIGLLTYARVLENKKEPTSQEQRTITISSDIATVSATLVNVNELQNKLDSIGFWGENALSHRDMTGFQDKLITAHALQVTLTDKPQPHGKTVSILQDGTEFMYQSFGMVFNESTGKLELKLHVIPSIIAKESSQDLGIRFSSLLLSSVYNLAHPLRAGIDNSKRLDGQSSFIKSIQQVRDNTFMTRKK